MLVRDELDIIEHIVRHLAANVDEILVGDHGSTDGTRELLDGLEREGLVLVRPIAEPGYYQARFTTALAMEALERGHRWVVPVDADEWWLSPDGRPIRDWMDGLGREVQFVKAAIYNHVCTALDPPATCERCGDSGTTTFGVVVWGGPRGPDRLVREPAPCHICEGKVELNPIRRIGWRQRAHLDMRWGKVACRLRPDLEIHQGNHSASTHGTGTTAHGLQIRHFPYRGPEHFTRKAKAGYAAYLATDLDESVGTHWRVYGRAIEEGGDEAGHAWFYEHFFAPDPERDDSLVYDPAPGA